MNEDQIPAFSPTSGVTVRGWFAGMALQGMLSGNMKAAPMTITDPEKVAKMALQYADRILEELNK